MNWRRGGEYFLLSDPPGFIINRANTGNRICYMAVRAVADKVGGDILHVERELEPDDDAGRLAALDRCRAACESAARE